jgi:hypothetical protein
MAVQTEACVHTDALQTVRSVVVVDRDLPKGLAANAAAVLALTMGARNPALIGPDFEDGDGGRHTGLIATGLPILGAPADQLPGLRRAARQRELLVVDLPAAGQRTTDYDAFRAEVRRTAGDELDYVAVLVSGDKRAVRSVTGQFGLLR